MLEQRGELSVHGKAKEPSRQIPGAEQTDFSDRKTTEITLFRSDTALKGGTGVEVVYKERVDRYILNWGPCIGIEK